MARTGEVAFPRIGLNGSASSTGNERSGKERTMNATQTYTRIATTSDAEKLRAMLARSSTETIYRRFHTPFPEVPGWMVSLMLDADHYGKEVLVAVAQEKVVGHAMYARSKDSTEAEIAIVVEDGWQSRGVGKTLLSELEERAALRGIEVFAAEVLQHNRAMLGLASTFPGTEYAAEDDVYHVRMPLRKTFAAPTLGRAA
jgi:GNAT superfamily N-acetyltransferase